MWHHVFAAAAVGISYGMALGQVQFHIIEHLPFTDITLASDLSADGRVIVGSGYDSYFDGRTPPRTEAFRWTEGEGTSPLGPYLGPWCPSSARATSADGSVIVGGAIFPGLSRYQAYRWTTADGLVPLGELNDDKYSHALGISGDGKIIVGTQSGQPFRWTAEDGIVTLSDAQGEPISGNASSVSYDGTTIIGRTAENIAFRWTEHMKLQSLGDFPGGADWSEAKAVNADGTVIVGNSESELGMEAFRWENGIMIGLGDLPGGRFASYASGVSADGSIIIGSSSTGLQREGFIWDAQHGMRNLATLLENHGIDLTGWTLSNPTGISADGNIIAGYGYIWVDDVGWPTSWIVRLPEPASLVLLVAGGCVILLSSRRS